MESGDVDEFLNDRAQHVCQSQIDGRLDELRRGGCNQKIAWSKLGCIATISGDGTGVETRHLACNPDDGRWALSEAYPIANVGRSHDRKRLQHVSWSNHGAELAVIDILDDDLNGLVGFWWLPSERPYSLHTALKTYEGFKFQAQNCKSYGPFHPVPPKAAAIGITRGGTVKMWFHDGTSKYQETSCELEYMTSLYDIFTHASISWNKENVAVLATYTHSRHLRVYRLAINWNITSQTKPATLFPSTPVLLIKRVKLVATVFPEEQSHYAFNPQLTHLEVLGPSPPQPSSPTIMAVFCGRSDQKDPCTFVCRWDLRDYDNSLHHAVQQLAVGRPSFPPGPLAELDLHRLEDTILKKHVIAISVVTSGTILAFAFNDGSFDFRDRHYLRPFSNSPFNSKVANMIQVGFAFTGGDICIDTVLSPNNAVAVRLSHDNHVQMMVMHYTSGPISNPDNAETACVALAVQHAYSCSNFLNNDDLLLVARRYKTPGFNNTFLTEVHRALNLRMDFAAESSSERLIRNPMLQRCLSLQYALDFHGDRVTRKLSVKLAWATLHLRVASLAFALTGNPQQRNSVQARPVGGIGQSEDMKPESLQTLLGLVRWFMDMISLIIGDLIGLMNTTKGHASDLKFVRQKMLESNSPALILSLASAPRAFLRYNCRSLRTLENNINKQLASTDYNDEQKMTIKSFKVPIDSCAIKINHFEKIMTDIDCTVRAAYNTMSEDERATAERLLFVNNEIPSIFREPIERILVHTMPTVRGNINISSLFWHDIKWLGLHDDIESKIYHRNHRIDAVRKIVLPNKELRLRRCTRCCSIVEDTTNNKNHGQWLQSTQRMCLCGTLWMHLNPQLV